MGSKSCVCLGDETEVKSIILGERGEKRLQPVSSSRGQLFALLQVQEKKFHSHFALSPSWEGLNFWSLILYTHNSLLRQNSGLSSRSVREPVFVVKDFLVPPSKLEL